MKFSILTTLTLLTSTIIAAPPSSPNNLNSISLREASPLENSSPLEKRKGGGGGKGGGSSGSSGGKGGSSGSGGSGGRPLSSYSFSPSSNAGGRTIGGSGTPPAYGGRYAGGAAVPYTAGGKSPTRGVAPYALGIGALGVGGLALFPGIWLYSSLYAYPYGYGYSWYEGGRNRTSNVTCLCQEYSVCGCDPQNNATFLSLVVSNGTGGAPVNSSTVRTALVNGTEQTFINGTLENGTTASGGTDPSNADEVPSKAAQVVLGYAGYVMMVGTVVVGIYIV